MFVEFLHVEVTHSSALVPELSEQLNRYKMLVTGDHSSKHVCLLYILVVTKIIFRDTPLPPHIK